MGISGIKGRLGSSGFAHCGALYASAEADDRSFCRGAAHLRHVSGGREEKGFQRSRQFWWEQPCDFLQARDVTMARSVVAGESEEAEHPEP